MRKLLAPVCLATLLCLTAYGQQLTEAASSRMPASPGPSLFQPIPDNRIYTAVEIVKKRLDNQRTIPPVNEAYEIFIPGVSQVEYKKLGSAPLDDWTSDESQPSAILLVSHEANGNTVWTLGIIDVLWEDAVKSKHAQLPMPFEGGAQFVTHPSHGFFGHHSKENWAEASLPSGVPTGNTKERRYLKYNPFVERYHPIFANDSRFEQFLKQYEEMLQNNFGVKIKRKK